MTIIYKTAKFALIWTTYSQNTGDFSALNLKVVVRACYRAYFLRMFLNIWRQILFQGDLHDDAL